MTLRGVSMTVLWELPLGEFRLTTSELILKLAPPRNGPTDAPLLSSFRGWDSARSSGYVALETCMSG